jgi:uncharacterized repeat protein (TIGR01451 family)
VAVTGTGASGGYEFTGLDPGRYRIRFVLPPGGAFTRRDAGNDDTVDSDPARSSGLTSAIGLGAGGTAEHWDAGLEAVPGRGDVDLETTITTDPANGIVLGPGADVVYLVTVRNIGSGDATGVVLLDLLPPRCFPGMTDPSGLTCPVAGQTDPPFAGGTFLRFPGFDENSDAVGDPSFRIDNPPQPPGTPAAADSERDVAQGGVVTALGAPAGVNCRVVRAVHGVRCDIPSLAAGAAVTVEIEMDINSWVRGSIRNRAWAYTDDQAEGNTIEEAGTPCGDTSQTIPNPPSDWLFPQPAGEGCNYAAD